MMLWDPRLWEELFYNTPRYPPTNLRVTEGPPAPSPTPEATKAARKGLKLIDKIPTEPPPAPRDLLGPEWPSRRERGFEEMRQAGLAAREAGMPRRRYYQGMLRDMSDAEATMLSDYIDARRHDLAAMEEHPEPIVRQRAGQISRDLRALRDEIAAGLHPSEAGIRELMEAKPAMLEAMAKRRGIDTRAAAIGWLKQHGASNKMAMEQLGWESQGLAERLGNAVRGRTGQDIGSDILGVLGQARRLPGEAAKAAQRFMQAPLSQKALSARRFLVKHWEGLLTPDPFELVNPVMLERMQRDLPGRRGPLGRPTQSEGA